jgi:hypothetical protein
MKHILYIVTFLLLASGAYSQCDNYHTGFYCRVTPQEAKDMVLSSQSRSAYVEANKAYNFQMTLFGDMDYRIIFCAGKKFYPIHYTITEKETGVLLYDNLDDDYIESIGFSIENTTIVIVEVTLLAKGAKFKDFRDGRTCIGIPILFRKRSKTGF